MNKVEFKIRAPKKTIAGMRKVDSAPANCSKCYYYIDKRIQEIIRDKKKENKEKPFDHKEIVVLRDFCQEQHETGDRAREKCTGCWVYTCE